MCVTMGDVIDGESHVAVVDLEKHTVVAQWSITGAPIPHTAGLDPIHHRLFVGSRVKPHPENLAKDTSTNPGSWW
jgi:hypothetical protein